MTEAFVDTSALYAFLVEDDDNHAAAEDALMALRGEHTSPRAAPTAVPNPTCV